jgi:Spy/CpxP family protein refolding chaperone
MIRNSAIAASILLAAQGFAGAGSPGGHRDWSTSLNASRIGGSLGLNAEQTEKVKQIYARHDAALTSASQAAQAAREALWKTTFSSPVDEAAVRSAAQAVARAEGDAAMVKARIHAEVIPLLDAEQKAKYERLPENGYSRRGFSMSGASN